MVVISFFSFAPDETLYPYRKKNKWGYCDKEKKIIIKCKYQETFPFINGIARVKQKNKYGFLDLKGNVAILIIYESASDFNGTYDC